MNNSPHLNKAPIVEALLDIRVVLPEGWDMGKLEALHELFQEKYPKKEPVYHGQAVVNFNDDTSSYSKNFQGFRFFSQDGGAIVQVGREYLTYNKLKPYGEWKTFLAEAKRVWGLFQDATQLKEIKQTTLRFINHVQVPSASELSDYFTSLPPIPAPLKQTYNNFFSTIEISDESNKYKGRLTQAVIPSAEPLKILLDIEAFCVYSVVNGLDFWGDVEGLRGFKNDIFFNSISEKLKEELK